VGFAMLAFGYDDGRRVLAIGAASGVETFAGAAGIPVRIEMDVSIAEGHVGIEFLADGSRVLLLDDGYG